MEENKAVTVIDVSQPETVTLEDDNIFKLFVDGTAQKYREGSRREGQFYHIFNFRGKRGTCTPEFAAAMKEGDIMSITLTETEYEGREAPDPNNPGKMIKPIIKGWTLDSYATSTMIINNLDKQEAVVTKRANLARIKAGATVTVSQSALTDEKMQKLQGAV